MNWKLMLGDCVFQDSSVAECKSFIDEQVLDYFVSEGGIQYGEVRVLANSEQGTAEFMIAPISSDVFFCKIRTNPNSGSPNVVALSSKSDSPPKYLYDPSGQEWAIPGSLFTDLKSANQALAYFVDHQLPDPTKVWVPFDLVKINHRTRSEIRK